MESIKLKKFENEALKKNEMFQLKGGGGTVTSGGTNLTIYDDFGTCYLVDWGYDVDRAGVVTYHARKNKRLCNPCPEVG